MKEQPLELCVFDQLKKDAEDNGMEKAAELIEELKKLMEKRDLKKK